MLLAPEVGCTAEIIEKPKYFPKWRTMARLNKVVRTRRRREDAAGLGTDGGL